MELYGTIDSLLEYATPQSPEYFVNQPVPDDKQEGSLEDLLSEKVRTLSSILCQIGSEIKSRETLSLKAIEDVDQHYCYLKTKLFELYSWEVGRSRDVEMRRSKLEKQLDTLRQEKRQEPTQCWRDVAPLRREFREWFKQYSDLVQRIRLVLPATKGMNKVIDNGRIHKESWPS